MMSSPKPVDLPVAISPKDPSPPSSPKSPEGKNDQITEKNWTKLLQALPTDFPERIYTIELDEGDAKSEAGTFKVSVLLKGCFGSGDENQRNVADLDNIVTKTHQVKLGLMLGDYRYGKKNISSFFRNFGIDAGGFTWPGDPHFKEYMTDVYFHSSRPYLRGVPMLGAIGNHERGQCKHGVKGKLTEKAREQGKALVLQTYLKEESPTLEINPNAVSLFNSSQPIDPDALPRFSMPHEFYLVKLKHKGKIFAELYVLDTSTLPDEYVEAEKAATLPATADIKTWLGAKKGLSNQAVWLKQVYEQSMTEHPDIARVLVGHHSTFSILDRDDAYVYLNTNERAQFTATNYNRILYETIYQKLQVKLPYQVCANDHGGFSIPSPDPKSQPEVKWVVVSAMGGGDLTNKINFSQSDKFHGYFKNHGSNVLVVTIDQNDKVTFGLDTYALPYGKTTVLHHVHAPDLSEPGVFVEKQKLEKSYLALRTIILNAHAAYVKFLVQKPPVKPSFISSFIQDGFTENSIKPEEIPDDLKNYFNHKEGHTLEEAIRYLTSSLGQTHAFIEFLNVAMQEEYKFTYEDFVKKPNLLSEAIEPETLATNARIKQTLNIRKLSDVTEASNHPGEEAFSTPSSSFTITDPIPGPTELIDDHFGATPSSSPLPSVQNIHFVFSPPSPTPSPPPLPDPLHIQASISVVAH